VNRAITVLSAVACPAIAIVPAAVRRQGPCPFKPCAASATMLPATWIPNAGAVVTAPGALLAAQKLPATAASSGTWPEGHSCSGRSAVHRVVQGRVGPALSQRRHRADQVSQPDGATRRLRGKADAIAAEFAARVVLASQTTASSRSHHIFGRPQSCLGWSRRGSETGSADGEASRKRASFEGRVRLRPAGCFW